MLINPEWQDVRGEFEPEGSWRDIYIFGTTMDDWQMFIDDLVRQDAITWFTVDSQPHELMSNAPDIFSLRRTAAPSLGFRLAGLDMACHFFTEDEIEIDFNPKDVTAASWIAFISGLRKLASRFNRDVVVTPENLSQVDILRVKADGGDVLYFPP